MALALGVADEVVGSLRVAHQISDSEIADPPPLSSLRDAHRQECCGIEYRKLPVESDYCGTCRICPCCPFSLNISVFSVIVSVFGIARLSLRSCQSVAPSCG